MSKNDMLKNDMLKNGILKNKLKKTINFNILKKLIIEFIQLQFQICHLNLIIHHQINQCVSFLSSAFTLLKIDFKITFFF